MKQQTVKATAQVEKQTTKMSKSYNKVGIAIKTMLAALSITAILAFGRSCIQLGSDLTEVQNVVDVTFGSMSKQVNAFSKNAITQFGLSELTAKKYMGTYGAMAKSFGIVEEAGYQMSASITGLTGDVASFYNLSTDEAYTKLKSIFTGETESLKDLGVVMTQSALDQFALANGYGKTTAKMSEQEKVMLRYKFVMNQLTDASGDFARTSYGWANQTRVLALQFDSLKATLGQGLINVFTPVIQVINTILAKLQTLASYFKAFTQALFGHAGGGSNPIADASDSMSSAAGSSGAVARNMGKAADSAKKMKDYTLGIDELNILRPEEEDGGSGGGGESGGGAPDFGNMGGELFGEVTVNPEIEAAVARMKEALDRLKDAAKPTTDAIKRLWDEGLAKLGTFTWTALGDFWNYFLVPLGSWALGEGLPRFFDITNNFLTSINWASINEALRNFWKALEPFAESVGTGLLNFYQDLLAVGADFINVVVPGGINGLSTALKSIDEEHAEKIGYALGVIGTALVGLKIAGGVAVGVKSLGAAIRTFPGVAAITTLFAGLGSLSGFSFWAALGVSLQSLATGLGGPGTASFDVIVFWILDQINSCLENLLPDWVNKFFGSLIAGLVSGAVAGSFVPGLGTVAGAIIGGIIGALNGIEIDGKSILKIIGDKVFNWDTMQELFRVAKESFDKAFSGDGAPWYEIGGNIIKGIASGISGCVAFLLEPIGDLLDWIVQGLCDVFGINSPAESMKPYGEYILLGVIEGFRNTFDEWIQSMSEWYSQYIAPWFTAQKWSELYNTIKEELARKWNETVGVWFSGVTDWWNKHVAPWFTAAKWTSLYNSVKTKLKETWDNTVGEWKSGVQDWWDNHVAPWFTSEKWLGIYENIKTSIKTKWDEVVGTWTTDIKSWWDNNVSPWFTLEKWTQIMNKVPEAFRTTFRNALEGARTLFNTFIDWLNEKMKFKWDDFEIMGQTIIEGGSVQLFTIPHIPAFATGGFPEDGLFMANSREMVGKFANGRTAVANDYQIEAGIQRGVREANEDQNELLREQNELLRMLIDKDTVIQMDSREVGRSIDSSRRRGGYRLRTT